VKIDLIKNESIQPDQWSGGKTFQLFIYPENKFYADRAFDFRISAASIHKSPSVFTKFDGYRRYLVMLDNDLKIVRNAKEEHYKKWEIFEFDSSDHIESFSTGYDFKKYSRCTRNC